jgi:hypothetical protein
VKRRRPSANELVDPVDYLADFAHGAVGPLQLFPTSM